MSLSSELTENLVAVACLVSLSGLFSGLTIGLSSLDPFELEYLIKARVQEAGLAKKVLRVAKNYNWLLTTLLLGNVGINVAIPIYLSKVASGPVAGLVSTVLIFLFGELLPAALCKKNALAVGAKTTGFVRVLMMLSSPVTWTIGKILDKTVGVEGRSITPRSVLMAEIDALEQEAGSDITANIEGILLAALKLPDLAVKDFFTPIQDVFTTEKSETVGTLTEKLLNLDRIPTRIPVLEDGTPVGILYSKRLLKRLLSNEAAHQEVVGDVFTQNNIISLTTESTMQDAFEAFLQNGKTSHLAFVFYNHQGHKTLLGIITLEDVMKSLHSIPEEEVQAST